MRNKRVRKQLTGDRSDPRGMLALMEPFSESLRIRNYSERTVETRVKQLGYFIEWTAARGVTRPTEVTKQIIERYQRFLYHYRKQNGNPMKFESQSNLVVAVRT